MTRNRFIEYTIKSGDTLHMISQRLLGDAHRAMEIAYLNDLDYPFIVNSFESGSESVKVIGDVILIPNEVEDDDSVENIWNEDDFGSDLLLLSDDELSFGYSGDLNADVYGDLKTIRGIDSLIQDLTHRIVTERGTMPLHPEYGSDFLSIIGGKRTTDQIQKGVLELSRTLRSDPRVLNVTDVTVDTEGTNVRISCNIVTPSGSFNMRRLLNL